MSAATNGSMNLAFVELPRRFTHLEMPRCVFEVPKKWVSLEAKVILSELDQLCTKRRPGRPWHWGWAGNDHFAALIDLSERGVQRALEELAERKLITIEFVADPKSPNHQTRWIALNGTDLHDALRRALSLQAQSVPDRATDLSPEVPRLICPAPP